MAEAATTTATTTRPARARKVTPAKATAKPAAKAVSAAPVQAAETSDGKTRVQLELEHVGATKSYEKFAAPDNCGCAGNFYAPLGTEVVKILLIGPAE